MPFNHFVPFYHFAGIGGLERDILKSATVSNHVACPAFTDMYFEAAPIVRVAIEPKSASKWKETEEDAT